ncbi:MAG: hypothetical protein ACOH1P_06610 [Lysobacter sp.]
MNRTINNVLGKWGVLLCVALLFGCAEPGTQSTAGTPAATKSAKSATSVDGLTFTISGPAFAEPATFVVPADTRQLRTYLSDSMFSLTVSPNDILRSTDGKHILTGLVMGTQPAGVGESTEAAGVTEATLSFNTDADSESRQGPSMAFDYSKGERQPMRIVMETYEEGERAAGHFTGKLQRTNIKSSHEIYDVTGTFNVLD